MKEYNEVMLQTYFKIDTREEADQIVKQIQQLKEGQLQGGKMYLQKMYINLLNFFFYITTFSYSLDLKYIILSIYLE